MRACACRVGGNEAGDDGLQAALGTEVGNLPRATTTPLKRAPCLEQAPASSQNGVLWTESGYFDYDRRAGLPPAAVVGPAPRRRETHGAQTQADRPQRCVRLVPLRRLALARPRLLWRARAWMLCLCAVNGERNVLSPSPFCWCCGVQPDSAAAQIALQGDVLSAGSKEASSAE